MTQDTHLASKWLTVVAILALIWSVICIGIFFRGINPQASELAALGFSEMQIAFTMSTPKWAILANIIAIVTGFLGSVALILRRQSAYYLFTVSLVAILLVMIDAFTRNGFEIVRGASNGLPISVIFISIYLFWTAHIAKAGGSLK